MKRLRLALLAVLLVLLPSAVWAQDVVPSARVKRAVVVRSYPDTRSEPVGRLAPGATATLAGETPGWYRVTLTDGRTGFVTKSWTVVLDAVAARTFVISSGPHPYSGVVLPDAEVVAELSSRGRVMRTDLNDAACGLNERKIGPDADESPGGCSNILVAIRPRWRDRGVFHDGRLTPTVAVNLAGARSSNALPVRWRASPASRTC